MRVLVKKGLIFWVACNPDEPLADMDMPTYRWSRTKEGAIAKIVRDFCPRPSEWEEVRVECK